MAVARQQRWVSFMVLAAMLDAVRDEDDGPLFLLKGGVAMELRLDLGARATKDFDAAFRAEATEILDRLDQALRAGHGDFTARRTEAEPVRETGAVRFDIKLDYRGRSWATVKFEVAPAEGSMGREIERVPAKPLDHLGLTGPSDVPCVAIRWQIAQKLHASTEVPADGRRQRPVPRSDRPGVAVGPRPPGQAPCRRRGLSGDLRSEGPSHMAAPGHGVRHLAHGIPGPCRRPALPLGGRRRRRHGGPGNDRRDRRCLRATPRVMGDQPPERDPKRAQKEHGSTKRARNSCSSRSIAATSGHPKSAPDLLKRRLHRCDSKRVRGSAKPCTAVQFRSPPLSVLPGRLSCRTRNRPLTVTPAQHAC